MREYNLTESITLTLKEEVGSSRSPAIGFYLNDKLIDRNNLEKRSFDKYRSRYY